MLPRISRSPRSCVLPMFEKDQKEFPARSYVSAAALVILGVLLYFPSLFGEFVSDDYLYIVDNPWIKNLSDWNTLWRSFPTRFLVMVSFAINHAWGGFNVFGFHAFNVLIHIANALLVWRLADFLFAGPKEGMGKAVLAKSTMSFFAALIFLCHPIQTQAVSFITQRCILLAVFFYLMTLLNYFKYSRSGQRNYLYLSILGMALGTISKEMIVTVPLIIFGYEYLLGPQKGQMNRTLLKKLFPFLMLALVPVVLLKFGSLGSVLGLREQLAAFDWRYFLTEMNVLRTYLRLVVLPFGLTHDYDYPLVQNPLEANVILSLSLLGGLFLYAIRYSRREPIISFCVLWFFITASVEVAVVSMVHRWVISEHWMYLPMAGVSMGLVYGVSSRLPQPRMVKWIFIILVAVGCILSFTRNFVWQNEIDFWKDNINKAPLRPGTHLGMGNAFERKGVYDQALIFYKKALDLDEARPERQRLNAADLAKIYNNMGIVYSKLRQRHEAKKNFDKALVLNPIYAEALNNSGIVAFDSGRYEDAISLFKRSMAVQGEYPYAYYYWAYSSLILGDKKQALEKFERARALCGHGECLREQDVQNFLRSYRQF